MCARPKVASASRTLWPRQRSARLSAVEGPPSAASRRWCLLRRLARRHDRALPLSVLLDRAAHRLAQHRSEIARWYLVREERLQLVELGLERGVHRDPQRIGVLRHRLERRSCGRRGRHLERHRLRRRRIVRHGGLRRARREEQRGRARRSGAVGQLAHALLRDGPRLDRDDEALHLRLRLRGGARDELGRSHLGAQQARLREGRGGRGPARACVRSGASGAHSGGILARLAARKSGVREVQVKRDLHSRLGRLRRCRR